jgi:hypothetical protein
MGPNTLAARLSIQQRSLQFPLVSRATSDAMCCAVSEPGKPILRFSGNFTSLRKSGFGFEPSSSIFFNHPNFGAPHNTLGDPLFGQSTQMLASSLASTSNAGFSPLYQIGGPRSIQLALKLQF